MFVQLWLPLMLPALTVYGSYGIGFFGIVLSVSISAQQEALNDAPLNGPAFSE